MKNFFLLMTPQEAWASLLARKVKYYDNYAAVYSGDCKELKRTGLKDSFWRRNGKSKIHVPIAADIASTSSNLLFSEEPRIVCFENKTEDIGNEKQSRIDVLIEKNNLYAKLAEAAETAAALGDVYLKISWDVEENEVPIISVVQADSAIAEYRSGVLKCVHFFNVLSADSEGKVVRLYECYKKGVIENRLFLGTNTELGAEFSETQLADYGFEGKTHIPVNELLAVHITNMKPNRFFRSSDIGRSDVEGLRELMDGLDEAYTSWLRDIRLAKSRLIVPAEYLKRKPDFKDGQYAYSFDEDVETLVALDIDTEATSGTGITPSQFEIRAEEHMKACEYFISAIISLAGYSPQTFGLKIDGQAQSGTALHIREKKSFNTKGKKESYWKLPLEQFLTALVRLDAKVYPGHSTDVDDRVKFNFPPIMANDLNSIAQSVEMLDRAKAMSLETKIQYIHPDWTGKQIAEEVERIRKENQMDIDSPNLLQGDFEGM